MTDTPLYELTDAAKEFGSGDTRVRALDGVDLRIERGEFAALAGPSGSGKTTMLQLLGALDRASSGTVMFEGRDLARLGDRELAELRLRRIGFVFQQFNLIPTLTALQNVEAALAPAGVKSAEAIERATELLGRVGLAGRLGHLPSQLSGGEQQRVAIARALANRPDVLLADEPTGNLDSTTGEELMELLGGLHRDGGLSLVLITHDEAIAARAGRVIRMRDGRIADGDPALTV